MRFSQPKAPRWILSPEQPIPARRCCRQLNRPLGKLPSATPMVSTPALQKVLAVSCAGSYGSRWGYHRNEIVEEYETPFIAQDAFEQLPEAIIAAQSWEVDIVSGATVTSRAIMAAVEDALTE